MLCPKCLVRERIKGQPYCRICRNAVRRDYYAIAYRFRRPKGKYISTDMPTPWNVVNTTVNYYRYVEILLLENGLSLDSPAVEVDRYIQTRQNKLRASIPK